MKSWITRLRRPWSCQTQKPRQQRRKTATEKVQEAVDAAEEAAGKVRAILPDVRMLEAEATELRKIVAGLTVEYGSTVSAIVRDCIERGPVPEVTERVDRCGDAEIIVKRGGERL